MLNAPEWLCERIGHLIIGVTTYELDSAFLVALTDKVILNVDVLALLIHSSVEGKILGSVVVHMQWYRLRFGQLLDICKKP